MLSDYTFTALSWILFVAAAAGLVTALALWRRRSSPGAIYLGALELGVAIWSAAFAWEMAATTVPLKIQWAQVEYAGGASTPLLFFLFATEYAGYYRFRSRRSLIMLSVIPAITFILVLTNDLHHWHWSQVSIDAATNIARFGHGPWFWVFWASQYILLIGGLLALLLTALRMMTFYRRQVSAILLASSLAVAGNVVYIFDVNPIPGMDWTPVSIMLAGVVLAWSIYRHRMFDLAPIARTTLVDTMSDGVMVIDSRLRIGDVNAAMAAMLGMPPRQIIGALVSDLLPDFSEMLPASPGDDPPPYEYYLPAREDTLCFDLHISPLLDPVGEIAAYVVVFRDITERKRLEAERDHLIEELQNTLHEVRTLSGLLPICASCKSIRDDQGYWHGVEAYLEQHSGARFSPGMCPECLEKLAPEAGEELA
jgi:PAS domain S-box-containing protein